MTDEVEYKVGDEVWVRGVVEQVDYNGPGFPVLVDIDEMQGFWPYEDDIRKDPDAEKDRQIAELEARNAELAAAIKQFADAQEWAHPLWKEQPHVKALYDIANTHTGGEEGND